MEILQLACEIGKCLWDPLHTHINYIKKFQENFEKLKQEAQYLYAKKDDVDIEIETDNVLKVPTNECKAWLKDVDEMKNKVDAIEGEFNENKKCLGECCPNFCWRMKLGKRIMIMIEEITNLKEKSKFERGMIVPIPPRIVEPTPTQMIEIGTSTECIVQEIFGYLRDEKIMKIGVWGMGGVGKTTVLKILNNSLEKIQMFQIVIWVTVSKNWNVRKAQKDIARRFSFSLEENESDDNATSKLFQKLRTMKFLLLLDDVWARVNLEAVGIPSPTRENECKIVLTSRSLSVCKQMGTNKEIKVNVLSDNEAWDLFHQNAGDVVNSPGIEPLASEVVNECGGLPVVLVVIGRSLRDESNLYVWSNAIAELRKATFQFDDEIEESVFNQLKFSFDRLRNDNVKNCFLYCALYPDDFEIPVHELIEQWWVEGFIDGILNLDEVYGKGHTILKDLINDSLLEKIDDYRHRLVKVKMHDVIRDLALKITAPQGEGLCKFVVEAGAGKIDLLNKEWEQVNRMSLMHCDLEFPAESPKCVLLTTLLLQNNHNLMEIPESFFEHMQKLRLLNLSNIGIKKLPWSLMNLARLQGLYLGSDFSYTGEKLYTLPSEVGHLTGLEVLHLGSELEYLPIEVGQLTRLRSLRVELTGGSYNFIPEGLLSRLTLLEDLRIYKEIVYAAIINELEGICSSPERIWDTKYTKAGVEELLSLKQLISLHFQFPTVENLKHFLQRSCNWNERRLKSFAFFVPDNFSGFRGDRQLDLAYDDASKRLSDLCSMKMMNDLEHCYIQKCNSIETVIDGIGLPNLETMDLFVLPELRSIWKGSVQPEGVKFLRHLKIENCPKLSNIFTRGMIKYLSNLEYLNIRSCLEIEEMVSEEDMAAMAGDNYKDMAVELFPRLKELHLYGIQKLARFCKRVPNPTSWPSLTTLKISGCPNMRYFPLSINLAPALADWLGNEMEFEDDATTQKLCHPNH